MNQDNLLDVLTTHDAIVPIDINFFICIDLWEHAYYVDYEFKRKEYLQNIFKLINWNIILNDPKFYSHYNLYYIHHVYIVVMTYFFYYQLFFDLRLIMH